MPFRDTDKGAECMIWNTVCSRGLSDTREGVSHKPLGILVCLVKERSEFGERSASLQHICGI